MKILWSEQSVQALEKIVKFYKRIAGEDVAIKIQNEIINATVKLEDHPKIGRIEPLLSFKNLSHRYIISGHCKIIYVIIDHDILITDVFDTRQEPKKIEKDI
jgi:plasmid stabilization system protein ParE